MAPERCYELASSVSLEINVAVLTLRNWTQKSKLSKFKARCRRNIPKYILDELLRSVFVLCFYIFTVIQHNSDAYCWNASLAFTVCRLFST